MKRRAHEVRLRYGAKENSPPTPDWFRADLARLLDESAAKDVEIARLREALGIASRALPAGYPVGDMLREALAPRRKR